MLESAIAKLEILINNSTYENFVNFIESVKGIEFDILPVIARKFLSLCKKISIPFDVIDICGTGGDALKIKTTNVSTISMFVLAKMGIPVAKHGGRAVSSSSGSVDFFEMLNFEEISPLDSLKKYNFCFLKAQDHHQIFKKIAPLRKEYGKKTIFNMLGPLINPANISHQMVGVSFENITQYANVVEMLGRKNFAVVMSESGGDELLSFEKNIAYFDNQEFEIDPKKLGLSCVIDDSIVGKSSKENVENAIRFFEHPQQNTLCETVALNCGMASFIFGKTDTITDGIAFAMETIFAKKIDFNFKT